MDLFSEFQHLLDVNQEEHDAVAKTQLENQLALCSNELMIPWSEQLLNRTYAAFCEEIGRMKIENFYDNWVKKTIIVISRALNNGVVEDVPIVNIMICGKIVSVAQSFGFKWILIEDQNMERVLCRLNIPKQIPEPQENKPSGQYDSARDAILIEAMESRTKDLKTKLNQLFVDSREDLLGRKAMVKGGMYILKGEKMIFVNKCWYANEMEEFYFHKMAVIGRKNWLLERESPVCKLGSNYLKNVRYDMT
ncbi:uncharacterized protein [Euwallacea similis]|uniref:uncharacterized protein n=1 Tax=Euwallacea similis TaxID=1736056 RepID=UPI00344F7617